MYKILTFNIPDCGDKYLTSIFGTDLKLGDYLNAGLPDIIGTITQARFSGAVTKCFKDSTTDQTTNGFVSGTSRWGTLDFKASNSNNIYNNSTTVRPASLVINYIIRY